MSINELPGIWDVSSAGGCRNFGGFGKNPAIAMKLTGDCDIMIRLAITAQIKGD
jgi:hypothetical protein